MIKFIKTGNSLITNQNIYLPRSIPFFKDGERYHDNDTKLDRTKESIVLETTKDVYFFTSKSNIDLSIFDEYNIIDIIAFVSEDYYREVVLDYVNSL